MAFQLTIAEGKDAGKQLVFDQASVMIGRTPECDIILYDPGVSRQHARISMEAKNGASTYFVEDMGSANGTRVNGEMVTRKLQLADGDAVGLGPVVFNFVAQEPVAEERTVIRAAPTVAEAHTRIVSVDDVSKERKSQKLLPEDTTQEDEEESGGGDDALARAGATSRPRTGGLGAGSKRGSGSTGRPSASALSAAQRARIKRESGGIGGTLKIFWADASPGVRSLMVALLVLAGLGAVGGAGVYMFRESIWPATLDHPEPDRLSHTPLEDSFGFGQGVTFSRADKKVFTFDANSASRIVAVLHYQARDITQSEVAITVNGAALGSVPPDTLAVNERSNELFIPANLVRKAEKNTVIFDNLHNPPNKDPWRVWNVWIEVAPLPDLPIDQLEKQASESFDRGQTLYERRNIGADSTFKAWKAFRNAWLMLEAHPDPKPEVYVLARDRMFEAQRELDMKCRTLMLEFQTYVSHSDWDGARATLDQVHQYFPNKEQPCPFRAEQQREEHQL